MHSGSCHGQYKNSYVSAALLTALEKCENLVIIDLSSYCLAIHIWRLTQTTAQLRGKKSSLVNRKQNIIGGKLNWREVRWLRYIKRHRDFFKNFKIAGDQTDVFPDACSDEDTIE
nr:unnamed protein product [Callosobruchus analis]